MHTSKASNYILGQSVGGGGVTQTWQATIHIYIRSKCVCGGGGGGGGGGVQKQGEYWSVK